MARTVEYFQQVIIDQLSLAGISVSGSRTSIRRLWTYVFAYCAWVMDVLFDTHRDEVTTLIAEQKPHRLRWYKNKALAFQYGFPLVQDSDVYDNTGIAEDLVLSSKIIIYCAVVETKIESRLIVKIATELSGKLQPITIPQKEAFTAYIAEIKDAGVPITVINYVPDKLYLNYVIYYDPLVLDATGNSILNGGRPVEDAISGYMKELPFNGELILAHLTDKLQKVLGVDIPELKSAETSWIDGQTNAYGPIENIDVKRVPESGYFEVVDFLNITYLANA